MEKSATRDKSNPHLHAPPQSALLGVNAAFPPFWSETRLNISLSQQKGLDLKRQICTGPDTEKEKKRDEGGKKKAGE